MTILHGWTNLWTTERLLMPGNGHTGVVRDPRSPPLEPAPVVCTTGTSIQRLPSYGA